MVVLKNLNPEMIDADYLNQVGSVPQVVESLDSTNQQQADQGELKNNCGSWGPGLVSPDLWGENWTTVGGRRRWGPGVCKQRGKHKDSVRHTVGNRRVSSHDGKEKEEEEKISFVFKTPDGKTAWLIVRSTLKLLSPGKDGEESEDI